jgi:hypothetical protein
MAKWGNKYIGHDVVYGAEGEHETPYMSRWWIGRLRFHVFHRGDEDPDCHDHPWGFWTFPLQSYVEEVLDKKTMTTYLQVVEGWRWSYRPAEHAHRVMYPEQCSAGFFETSYHNIVPEARARQALWPLRTIVWREKSKHRHRWGFWKVRTQDGVRVMCFSHWKNYVFQGGKHAPCEPPMNIHMSADVLFTEAGRIPGDRQYPESDLAARAFEHLDYDSAKRVARNHLSEGRLIDDTSGKEITDAHVKFLAVDPSHGREEYGARVHGHLEPGGKYIVDKIEKLDDDV